MRLKPFFAILAAIPIVLLGTTESEARARRHQTNRPAHANRGAHPAPRPAATPAAPPAAPTIVTPPHNGPARGMINAQGVEVFWDEPVEVPLAQARQDVLTYTNRARAALGCPPLVLNNRLNAAAQRQANGMAMQNYFDHQAPDGSHPHDRVAAAGYNYALVAENIAAGQISGAAAVDEWMGSPNHRANIAECSFTELGVGYAFENDDQIMPPDEAPLFHYWVQVFGVPQ